MTETSTIGGERLQRPCHGIESSEGGGFQWVQAAPGDSLQPEATGAGIEISGHRRGHRITPGPAGLSEVLQFARRPAGPVCSRLSAGGSRIRTSAPSNQLASVSAGRHGGHIPHVCFRRAPRINPARENAIARGQPHPQRKGRSAPDLTPGAADGHLDHRLGSAPLPHGAR